MSEVIRVLLVDDHPIVLSGLSALVGSDRGLHLVVAARTVSEALAGPVEAPDVALVDLDLPDGDGISLGVQLKQRWPDVRVVLLTMHSDQQAVMRSLGSGLDGYLLKDADPEDILAAIHTVAGGTMVLGQGVAATVVAAAASGQPATGADALAPLDARDREILALLVRGFTTSQVAARLFLAPKTIRNRVSDIVGKLGVTSREEAIRLGRDCGLS
ncbi:response regulator [Spongisporangium articulatum]|uniref:Response regulator n=1 Tax=Spongisporangium articulatum TaxID=3362603 RepID=A0ABW8AL32_9ACTN